MADDTTILENQPTVSEQIAEQMAISLNHGIVPQTNAATEPPVTEPPAHTEPSVINPFDVIREKYSYATAEDAIKEIEELRALKNNPVPPAIKFADEFNKKLFKAIQNGQTKEVTAILKEQEKLESLTTTEITKDTAADIIKLGMQLEYKTLSPAEIEYKYKQQFGLPKEPVKTDIEEEDDFLARKNEWQEKVNDIEMNRMIEAKMALPKLEGAKTKIQLPELPTIVDEGYNQYLKMLEKKPAMEAEVLAAYKSFTTKSIETKLPFIDEANKIAFDFQFEPDSETFNKSVDMVLNIDSFFDLFVKPDGTPDRQGFLDAIYFATNKEKIIMEAIKQAKNATIKSFLPDNSGGGMQRHAPGMNNEPNELQQHMQAALGQYMPKQAS